MLKVTNLKAGYGRLSVLKDITFEVPDGKVVVLLGSNGAGKTTTMKAIMGLIRPQGGTVEFAGARIDQEPAHRIYARGLSLVPQGRELFPEMTVAENLELGALQRRDGDALGERLARVFEYLPKLRERLKQRAGTLSGGEQQMLATARALMADPQLLLLDEPSMGLAPLIVAELGRIIGQLNQANKTILLVEQNIRLALGVADYVYVIRNGTIVTHGDADTFKDETKLFQSYLG